MNHTQRSTLLQAIGFRVGYLQTAINNAVDFPIRNLIKWRRGKRFEIQEQKDTLYNHLIISEKNQANDIALALKNQYKIEWFWESTSQDNLRISLFYLEMLDRALKLSRPGLPNEIKAADIGCGDWFYVKVLKALLEHWRHPAGRKVKLSGYEADPYKIHSDLFSRMDYAAGHLDGLDNVRYIPHKFTAAPDTFHVITMLLPFVFIHDHLNSGLPAKQFKPQDLLQEAWSSLKKGGALIIVNRGRDEHMFQLETLASLNIEPIVRFLHTSLLYHDDDDRYVLVALKK